MPGENPVNHPSNLIKRIQKLQHKRARMQHGLFFAQGNRLVAEAIQAGVDICECLYVPNLLKSTVSWQSLETLRQRDVPITAVSPQQFQRLSPKKSSAIGIVARSQSECLTDIRPGKQSLGWVALDSVANPGNLGTIMRTCDAVGCEGILLLGPTTDPFHPTAVQASMGAVFTMRFVCASFAEFLRWKQAHGIVVVGTSGTAVHTYRQLQYPAPSVLLMGSERMGLSCEQQAACDLVASIPMVGSSDSLNLAVATGVMLYEIFHQIHA
ncbi:MAG: RNA methyltransferase [Chloroflexi bacterium]|nr:MAG: RNA methyltransferase [Chloroflexota bacterium]